METLVKISMRYLVLSVIASLLMFTVVAGGQGSDAGLENARKLLEDHRYDEAHKSVDAYLKTHPNDPDAVIVKSDIFAAVGEWDRSVDTLQKGLSADENNVDLLMALAGIYREKLMRSGMLGKMSNAKKSRQSLEKAFELQPSNLEVRKEMVQYLVHAPGFAGGDKDRAMGIALETVELDEAEGRLQLGIVYRQKEEYDKSIEQFNLALELAPDIEILYYMLGYVYMMKEDFPASEGTFGKYIKLYPDAALSHDGLGDCYVEQKRLDDAIAQYSLALDKDAWYGDARYKLAGIYYDRKDYEQAKFHYEQLLGLNPGYVDAGKAKKKLRKIKKGR